jgi:hypothetical protein
MLPPSLTKLTLIFGISFGGIDIMSDMLSLTSLSLRTNTNLYFDSNVLPSLIKSLPRGLVSLKFDGILMDEDIQHLPIGLTKLNMPATTISSLFWSSLPRGLTQCTKHYLHDLSHFNHLPHGLKNLKVIDIFQKKAVLHTSLDFSQLPRTLTVLNIFAGNFSLPLCDNDLLVLPQGLRELCILGYTLPADYKLTMQFGLYLPPFLEKLLFNVQKNTQVTEDFVQFIPRTIRVLSVTGLPMSDRCVQHLPPGLQEFHVAGSVQDFTDASVAKLPRSLKLLNLTEASSHTDLCMADMPRDLQTLQLPSNVDGFTESCLTDVPKSLTWLDLRKCVGLIDTTVPKPPGRYPFKLRNYLVNEDWGF